MGRVGRLGCRMMVSPSFPSNDVAPMTESRYARKGSGCTGMNV